MSLESPPALKGKILCYNCRVYECACRMVLNSILEIYGIALMVMVMFINNSKNFEVHLYDKVDS